MSPSFVITSRVPWILGTFPPLPTPRQHQPWYVVTTMYLQLPRYSKYGRCHLRPLPSTAPYLQDKLPVYSVVDLGYFRDVFPLALHCIINYADGSSSFFRHLPACFFEICCALSLSVGARVTMRSLPLSLASAQLLGVARCQFPPPQEEVVTIQSKFGNGISISYKEVWP